MSSHGPQTPAQILAAHVTGLAPGQAVDLEQLCRDHPDEAPDLRRLTAHWEQLSQVMLAMSGQGGGTLAERLRQRFGDVDPGLSIDRPPTPARPASTASGTLERLESHEPTGTRYETRREVARGGMGAILEVWDGDLRRTLAMKVALDKRGEGSQGADPRLLARFLEEAQITAQLDHPGIVPVHELGLDAEGRVYFTMPLVRGRDLAGILELTRSGAEDWNLPRALGVLLKVCEAMAYAHSKQVVHRDLKPANIMVGRFGEVYVMDWGLAKVIGREDSRDLRLREVEQPEQELAKSLVSTDRDALSGSPLMTMDGDVVGTPSYMSPEQARGELEAMSPASDVYSIGAILYHLLAGHMPFVPTGSKRNAYAVWGLLQSEAPEPLSKLAPSTPGELVAICEKAMARDAAGRYPDTLALAEDLRAYLEGRVVSAHATGALTELRKWIGRNKPLAVTIAAALALVVSILCVTAYQQARFGETLSGKEERLVALEGELSDKEQEAASLLAAARAESYVANVTSTALNQQSGNYVEAARRLAAAPEELRGWEWQHLNLGHNAALVSIPGGTYVACWGSGEQIVYGSHDGLLYLREWESGALINMAQVCEDAITALVHEPNAGRYACGGSDGYVVTWETVATSSTHWDSGNQSISSVAVSPDGGWVIGGQGELYVSQLGGVFSLTEAEGYSIFVWSPTGDLLATLEGSQGPVRALLCLGDGRLVSAGDDGYIRVWDVAAGKETQSWRAHSKSINDLVLGPRGQVVSISDDTGVIVWDLEARARGSVLQGHTKAVLCGDTSPDGRLAVTGSADQTLIVWELATGSKLVVLRGHQGPIHSVQFSPDGSRIVSASPDDGVRVWQVETDSVVSTLGRGDHRMAERALRKPKGGRLGRAWFLFLDGAEETPMLLSTLSKLDPSGTVLAGQGSVRRFSDTYRLALWSTQGESLAELEGHSAELTALAWSTDGTQLASGAEDRTVRLWDPVQLLAGPVFEGFAAQPSALAWRPDGSALALGSADGGVFLIEVQGGARRELPGQHQGRVRSLCWTADGQHLASAGPDGEIYLWSPDQDTEPARLLGHQGDVTCLAFSADGERLFSGSADKSVRVWHRRSGVSMLTLRGMLYPVEGLALSRGDRRLVVWERSRYPAVWVLDSSVKDAQDMWRERAQAQRATDLVQDLVAQQGSAGEVRAALEARDDLPEDVLAIARVLAERLED